MTVRNRGYRLGIPGIRDRGRRLSRPQSSRLIEVHGVKTWLSVKRLAMQMNVHLRRSVLLWGVNTNFFIHAV